MKIYYLADFGIVKMVPVLLFMFLPLLGVAIAMFFTAPNHIKSLTDLWPVLIFLAAFVFFIYRVTLSEIVKIQISDEGFVDLWSADKKKKTINATDIKFVRAGLVRGHECMLTVESKCESDGFGTSFSTAQNILDDLRRINPAIRFEAGFGIKFFYRDLPLR